MEPLILTVLLEFSKALLAFSGRILDMPKSPTRALVFCKENVAWLEIAMNYWRLAVIMKIVQSINDVNSNM
jgi:hypothetical protein